MRRPPPIISRRKRFVFATIAFLLPIVVMTTALVLTDLYLHRRAERSAGLNRWGYRGPVVGRKQPGEVRIAVLGGSTAFGYGLPWQEAAPAVLEQILNSDRQGRPPVSVVNLAFNNEGAYSYRFTLDDYASLDYDVACLFDGYNDMAGDTSPNTALYRHDSAVFRLTGYYPILPLVFAEKAMSLRTGGNLNAGYAAFRGEAEGKTVFKPGLADRTSAAALESVAAVTESLGKQLGRLSVQPPPQVATTTEAGCPSPWRTYCESMYIAIRHALDLGKRVAIVLQPRLPRHVSAPHQSQQAALSEMLKRHFGADPRVRAIDLSAAVDLEDRNYTFDGMHLSTDGTEKLVRVLAVDMAQFLTPPAPGR